MKHLTFAFIIIALCSCGCKTAKKEVSSAPLASSNESMALTGTHWTLTHLYCEAIEETPAEPFITFNGNTVSGNLGCNTFFGNFYASPNGKLDFEYTGSTKKLCQDMNLEYDFISALKSEHLSYTIIGDILIIKGDVMQNGETLKNKEILRFKAVKNTEE